MPITVGETIRRIPSWENASSIAISPLPGGITNFNYRVDVDGEAFHLRIWAERAGLLGIDRQREYHCAVAASRAGVAPEVVHFLPDKGVTVTRFVAGRSLKPGEALPPETLGRVIDAIRRCHDGPAFEGTFSAFEAVAQYAAAAQQAGAPLPDDIPSMLSHVRAIETALGRVGTIVRPCHNDLWGPNMIDDGHQVRIVDWEYAGMGDICFDLANLAIHHTLSEADDDALLRAYFGEIPDATLARFNLLKIVAELREALWYLVALNVSNNPSDFVNLAQTHFDWCRRALHDSRVARWLDQAARAG